jgi:large subunit ribosomal protein L4
MQVELFNDQGHPLSTIELPDNVFARPYNEGLVHQVLTAYQTNARQGSRAQKNRSAVNHSTKKPFRQKGTGNARAGMTSSPIWRGGGRAFPNCASENFHHKINKKMYRAAMVAIFSQLVREGRIIVIDSIIIDAPKTKLLAEKLKALNLNNVILIVNKIDANLQLAARNLIDVHLIEPRSVDPASLIFYKKIILTQDALKSLGEMFQ